MNDLLPSDRTITNESERMVCKMRNKLKQMLVKAAEINLYQSAQTIELTTTVVLCTWVLQHIL
jgi:hypothetical protein